MKKWTQNWTTPMKVLLAGAGLCTAALLLPMAVSAVQPAANTVIGNQAAATFTDAAGKLQEVKSNLVSTTVVQVAAVALTDGLTKTATAGNTVYVPHTATNNGNGTDPVKITVIDSPTEGTFSNIAVYADLNGSGAASGQPLCSGPVLGLTVPLCSDGFIQSIPALGAFNFVVAYTVPSNATTPTAPFNTATLRATSGITPSVNSGDKTDTVNLTSGAAFTSSKAVAVPLGINKAAALNNWPVAITAGKPSLASCSNTITDVNTALPGCTYTVYTIAYQNNGNSTGSFYVEDALPAGLSYVPGTAVWSSASGVALIDSSATLASTMPAAGINVAYDSAFTAPGVKGKFKAVVQTVNPTDKGTISFVVMINSTAAAGVGATNNVASYATTSCDNACATSATAPTLTTTNTSPFTVSPTYKVIAANVSSAVTTDGANPPASTDSAGNNQDLVEVPTAFLASKTQPFSNFIINKGNVTDTFNVTVPSNDYPAGTTFAFYKVDGATPLIDTNGDGKIDTGPIAAEAFIEIKMVATLPPTATAAELSRKVDAKVTATSANDSTVADSVWNRLNAIVSSKVDVTNTPDGNRTVTNGTASLTQNCVAGSNCDLGQGPSLLPVDTESVKPGQTAAFPIYVTNTSGSTADFALTATVPPGWDVKFTTASNCAAPITAVTAINVPTGATGPSTAMNSNEKKVLACVTPPAGAVLGTTVVSFTAIKSGDASATDTVTDAVNVLKQDVASMQLGPNTGLTAAAPGGAVIQPVTIVNSGTTSCGAGTGANAGFNVKVTLDSAAVTAGWTAVVYYDVTGSGVIDSSAQIIDASLAATAQNLTSTTPFTNSLIPLQAAPANVKGLPLLLKFFSPSGALMDSVATATMTVTDLNADVAAKCPAQTAFYSSKIVNGQLTVTKMQALDDACDGAGTITAPASRKDVNFVQASLKVAPAQCLIYKVQATNGGSAPVSNVKIMDTAPSYTTLYPASESGCTLSSANATGTATYTTVGGVGCSGGANPGITLSPGGSMTLRFVVKVDNQ